MDSSKLISYSDAYSHAQLPLQYSLTKRSQSLNLSAIELFQENGCSVIDNALYYCHSYGILEEINYLDSLKLLTNNVTAYVTQHKDNSKPNITQLFAKQHIYETE